MSTTLRNAQDDILDVLLGVATTLGVPVVWEARPNPAPPSTAAPWMREVLRHATGGQASLAGDAGQRRWERRGVLIVQVFVPLGSGRGLAYSIAQELLDAYEGARTEHCVWFRNARVNEIGPDGAYFQVNFAVDFEYTEVK